MPLPKRLPLAYCGAIHSIPWNFQQKNTLLQKEVKSSNTAVLKKEKLCACGEGYRDNDTYHAGQQGTPSESGEILQKLHQAKRACFYGAESLAGIIICCHLC